MTKQREKYYKKSSYKKQLQQIIQNIIDGKIEKYDIKQLHGYNNLRRLRKGNIRIIFKKHEGSFTIHKIDTRGDVYKNI